MKNIFYLIIALLLSASSIEAQTTEGREFWVTFGQNALATAPPTIDALDLRIRIIGGGASTFVNIYFTNLGTFGLIDHYMAPYEVYDYVLTIPEKHAVYNIVSGGTTNCSIHITASNPVSVFASNWWGNYSDVTNILPVTALGTEYYQISYKSGAYGDAYAVIATEDGTYVYHDNEPVAILDAGEVYYKNSGFFSDMTCAHITATANKPVAFFAMNTTATVWGTGSGVLFQQLASVNTWGKTFFVPVTVCGTEYVRILASENTTIKQTGGTIVTGTGGQSSLNLQAGQFVELEILLSNSGCFISADKPVGVCSFMRSHDLQINPIGQCSQVWIPAIEQTIPKVLMAPFVLTYINYHHALVVTPTATRDETKVSIGGGVPKDLTGGSWYAHTTADADMSFYNFPLTNLSASHTFSNPAGIIVLGYGIHGEGAYPHASYYYLAGSAMRDLVANFYANDVYHGEMVDHLFCERDIEFFANIEGIHPDEGSLKWYIGTDMYAIDQKQWIHTFTAPGSYTITMEVKFEDETTVTYPGTLNIGAIIIAEPFPIEGGSVEGARCFAVNEMVELIATPADGYKFMEWREDDIPVSPAPPSTYSFPAEEDRTLVAHFAPMFCGGTGTPTDPYLICNAEQLDSVRVFLDKHYKLANDINLTTFLSVGYPGYNAGEGWEPIGDAEDPFTGTLNGDGHKIIGLWINRTGDYIGLFGFIDGAVIKNVGVIISD